MDYWVNAINYNNACCGPRDGIANISNRFIVTNQVCCWRLIGATKMKWVLIQCHKTRCGYFSQLFQYASELYLDVSDFLNQPHRPDGFPTQRASNDVMTFFVLFRWSRGAQQPRWEDASDSGSYEGSYCSSSGQRRGARFEPHAPGCGC